MINGFEDVQKAGQENMNRALESFGALSRGMQTLADETAAYSKTSFEASAAHMEKLLGTKSVEGAFEAQTRLRAQPPTRRPSARPPVSASSTSTS